MKYVMCPGSPSTWYHDHLPSPVWTTLELINNASSCSLMIVDVPPLWYLPIFSVSRLLWDITERIFSDLSGRSDALWSHSSWCTPHLVRLCPPSIFLRWILAVLLCSFLFSRRTCSSMLNPRIPLLHLFLLLSSCHIWGPSCLSLSVCIWSVVFSRSVAILQSFASFSISSSSLFVISVWGFLLLFMILRVSSQEKILLLLDW